LYVGLEALNGEVSAAVIERNANAHGFLPEDSGFLKLLGGETTAGAHLVLVPAGLAVHNGPEEANGAGGEGGGLGLTLQPAGLLLGGLLEVDGRPESVGNHAMDSTPRLVVMLVRQDVVVLGHGGNKFTLRPTCY